MTGEKEMTDKQWMLFADALDGIMALPGAWQDKRNALMAAAKRLQFESALGELVNWFEGNYEQ